MAAYSVEEDSKKVLRIIMDNGAFDDIRKKVVEDLRKNEELKAHTLELMVGCDCLANVDPKAIAGNQPKRKKLLEEVTRELQDKLSERASRMAWELLSKQDSEISQEIEDKIREAHWQVLQERQAPAPGAPPTGGPTHTGLPTPSAPTAQPPAPAGPAQHSTALKSAASMPHYQPSSLAPSRPFSLYKGHPPPAPR